MPRDGRRCSCLNAGSSSIKFALFEIQSGAASACVAKGEIDGIGTAPHFVAKDADGAASGIDRFDALLEQAAAHAPEHHLVDIADVGPSWSVMLLGILPERSFPSMAGSTFSREDLSWIPGSPAGIGGQRTRDGRHGVIATFRTPSRWWLNRS
jgi:hypothetical protein